MQTTIQNKDIKIEYVSIDILKPAEYNPRTWDTDAEHQLKESIRKYGIVDPLLVNSAENRKNIIIGGHFRLEIIKSLGYDTVPVVYLNIPDLEREKELKDGGVNRHVYYHCCKSRNIDCKNQPINEPNLIEELANLLDRITLDELGIKEKIEQEVSRFNKFRIGVLGHKKESRNSEVDTRNYAKYLLKEGTIYKSKLTLKDRKIELG